MSRYNLIDTITYNDKNGTEYPVKDVRPIPSYINGREVPLPAESKIDGLITREDNFGPDTEEYTYAVTDYNIEKLAEHNFDLSRLKRIRIPVLEEVNA